MGETLAKVHAFIPGASSPMFWSTRVPARKCRRSLAMIVSETLHAESLVGSWRQICDVRDHIQID